MKIVLTIIIIIFSCFRGISQNIIVADSLTKKPLSFTVIKFNQNGFYTSQKGDFNINKIDTDSFEVSMLGYKKAIIKTTTVKDTLFLSNEINLLDEVVVSNNKTISKNLKLLKSPNIFGSWVLQPKSEILAAIYPSNEIKNYYIDKIHIGFAKVKEKKELKDSNIKAYVRLHIYELENNKPSNSIYSSEPIDVNSFEKDEIVFDISNNLIKLEQNGIFVGLELIGYYSEKSIFTDFDANPIIRPLLTKKNSNYFSSKTFIRYVFKNQIEMITVGDSIRKGMTWDKEIIRNLNIGFEISK
ncbi:peptidase associated/transthyretin-like domain-containing protein [Lacinutrix jangbogonensis]|uniref:carboxypeptidase-like regulatory domain-containing protein n=1 Tax=Lacinutrix jangbogonensis TaxID=1469557 RepID=UPI00053E1C5B|nr:carboxypeptidase-like regulatory domain-containing protein [Lacinutrix jangbogonensis]